MRVEIVEAQPFLRRYKVEDRRIEIARNGSHRTSPSSGVKPSICVDGLTADDRTCRSAVAEVKRDDLRRVARAVGELAVSIRDVAVGRPVKAVAAHAIAPVELIRDCIEIRRLGQAVMESGVENGDLGDTRSEHCTRRRDPSQVVWIVQRSKLDKLVKRAHDRVVNPRGVREPLAPVNDTMTHSFYVTDAGYRHAGRIAGEPGNDVFHGGGIVPISRTLL